MKHLRVLTAAACVASVALAGCAGRAKDRQKMVEALLTARRTIRPIAPLSQQYDALSIEEAYRVQEALVRQLTPWQGPPVGYKVAFTSRDVQEIWKVDEPAHGRLLTSMRAADGSVVNARTFLGMVIELEVAFVIDKPIDRPLKEADELLPYVRSVHPAFDLSTIRFVRDRRRVVAADVIADIAGAHRFILGPAKDPATIDLSTVVATLKRDGRTVYRGPASAAMGSPWNVLLWLSNKLIARGAPLQPGDVILTGALDRPLTGRKSRLLGQYIGRCGPLGTVQCTITAPASRR